MRLVLYHAWISTCSQKVRVVLAEKELVWDSRPMNLANREQTTEEYLAINANGVVPTLVDGDEVITDSSVICEYLDETRPDHSLSPADPVGRARMRAWMRFFEEVSTPAVRVPSFNRLFINVIRPDDRAHLEAISVKAPLRKHFYRAMGPQGFSEDKEQEAMDRLALTIARVDAALEAGGGPFLLGALSNADIALLPSIVRLEDMGFEAMWESRPKFSKWYAEMRKRPSFAAAYPQGSRVTAPLAHTGTST